MKKLLLIGSVVVVFLLGSCTPTRVGVRAGPKTYYRSNPYYYPRPYYNPYYYRNNRPWGHPHHRSYYKNF